MCVVNKKMYVEVCVCMCVHKFVFNNATTYGVQYAHKKARGWRVIILYASTGYFFFLLSVCLSITKT